ncbi:hypothetical protein ACWGCW_34485 [Streptomyces sp. NPDC054933]
MKTTTGRSWWAAFFVHVGKMRRVSMSWLSSSDRTTDATSLSHRSSWTAMDVLLAAVRLNTRIGFELQRFRRIAFNVRFASDLHAIKERFG